MIQTSNLLGLKLTTNVILLSLSAVDNNIFVYFLCHKYGLIMNTLIVLAMLGAAREEG